jgi:hypothetical protein
VIDEEPERIGKLVVNATSEKQGTAIEEFEERGIIQFVPLGKK